MSGRRVFRGRLLDVVVERTRLPNGVEAEFEVVRHRTCARRELAEEAGLAAPRLEPLGWIWTTPGFTDERIWLFLATGLEAAEQRLEADEVLSVVRLPLARAVAMAASGEIVDGKSVTALLRAAPRLGVSVGP